MGNFTVGLTFLFREMWFIDCSCIQSQTNTNYKIYTNSMQFNTYVRGSPRLRNCFNKSGLDDLQADIVLLNYFSRVWKFDR